MEVFYEGVVAGNSANASPDGTVGEYIAAPGAQFQVFEKGDAGRVNPLTVKIGGRTSTTINTSDRSVMPDLYVISDNYEHVFKSGDFEWERGSNDGMQKAADEARAAAQQAVAEIPERVLTELEAAAAAGTFKGEPGKDGSNVVPTAKAIADEIKTPGTLANTALSATYAEVVSIAGDGIDPSGAAFSTAAIQAKLTAAANKQVYLPPGTYKVAGTLTVSGERTRLYGPGVLSWAAGIENAPALRITGRGAIIDGVTLRNPLELGAKTGSASSGLQIQAHDVVVTNCLIDSFQTGIHVYQNGEWMDIVIANNRIKDVLGSGDGPTNTTSDRGEDRGDGIMVMGAGVAITGNVINAKAGRDARIGIHCEALTDQAPVHPAGENRTFTISGNIITGPFRRSIATEDVSNVAITGNACADATWWGISVSGTCHGVTVTGNTLVWTKPAGQTPGLAWGPKICCFQILNAVKGVIFADNIVTIKGAAKTAFLIDGTVGLGFPSNITIADNIFQTQGGTFEVGIGATANGIGDIALTGNTVQGFTLAGASISGVSDFAIAGNRFDGVTPGASNHWGVLAGGATKGGIISGNQFANSRKGIERVNAPGGTVMSGNVFSNLNTALDLYGTSNCVTTNNAFITCTTTIANSNATNIATGNVTVA